MTDTTADAASAPAATPAGPAVGDRAPSFRIATKDGEITSESLAGKAYVLYFYPRDDTPGCTREAIDFTSRSADFAAAGVTVIGVSKDDLASHAKFAAKHDLAIELGSDPGGAAIAAFGAWVEKSMYGKKYMGIDRATVLVDAGGTVRAVWRKVKVAGHADKVLAAARALGG